MKLYKHFMIRQRGCPPGLYSIIKSMRLDVATDEYIRTEARTGEFAKLAKMDLLVALCRAWGLKRSKGGEPGTYGFEMDRVYEASDFNACDLLMLGPQRKYQLEDERDAEGRIILTGHFKKELEIGSVFSGGLIVSDKVRSLLEAGRLIGVNFVETASRTQTGMGVSSDFWEVQPSFVLPKMANTNRFLQVGSAMPPEPFGGDYSRMVDIADPPYRFGEAHYRRSDLRALGLFDMARTFEKFRNPVPPLVVSQRFYQHCLKQKIPLEVEPVRIDPD